MTEWVYLQSERPEHGFAGLWTVGFYSPDGAWHPETDFNSADEAAERVHWLNGGERK